MACSTESTFQNSIMEPVIQLDRTMQRKIQTSPYGIDHVKFIRHHKLPPKYFLLEADVRDPSCSKARCNPKNSGCLIVMTSLDLSIEVLMVTQFYFVG